MDQTRIDIFRSSHVEREMRTISVVEMNSLGSGQSDLTIIDETSIECVLMFEGTNHPFCKDVVVAVANGTHTWPNTFLKQNLHVRMSTVLDPMIGMMNAVVFYFREVFKRHS